MNNLYIHRVYLRLCNTGIFYYAIREILNNANVQRHRDFTNVYTKRFDIIRNN